MQPAPVSPASFVAPSSRLMKTSSWTLDPDRSSVDFSVRHLMVAKVHGSFSRFTASLLLDRATPRNSSVSAIIEAASVDTRDLQRDEDLKGPGFFDVATFPTLTFKSRRFEAVGLYEQRIVGDLTLRGVTHEAIFDAESSLDETKDPYGNIRIALSASAQVNRADFGLGASSALQSSWLLVGDQIAISLHLQFIQRT